MTNESGRKVKFAVANAKRSKKSDDETAKSMALLYSLFFNNAVFFAVFALLTSGLTSTQPLLKYGISTLVPSSLLLFLTKPTKGKTA